MANIEDSIEKAKKQQEEVQSMAQKIIDHLEPEHITSLNLLESLLEEFLREIKMLKNN